MLAGSAFAVRLFNGAFSCLSLNPHLDTNWVIDYLAGRTAAVQLLTGSGRMISAPPSCHGSTVVVHR